ncbi:hypothetical protein BVRB_032680, partial [Beta vulgaris subsp. vulgaris]
RVVNDEICYPAKHACNNTDNTRYRLSILMVQYSQHLSTVPHSLFSS